MSVNSGVNHAVKMIQEIIHDIHPAIILDGCLGKQTLSFIDYYQQKILASLYCKARKDFYDEITDRKKQELKKKLENKTISADEYTKNDLYLDSESRGWHNRIINTNHYYEEL
jgi:lysozyme family protein